MDSLQFQQKLIGIQDRLMNFALKLTANREDALDLLQDTTLKVLNSQEKFTDNVNFAGWVMVIMRNLFINNYHKMVRAQTSVDHFRFSRQDLSDQRDHKSDCRFK